MQAGRRNAAWDHTAAIITHLRKVHGDDDARFEAYHPDYAKQYQRTRLREFSRQQRNDQANQNQEGKPK